jgi:pyrroloquinoline-quinone synthase
MKGRPVSMPSPAPIGQAATLGEMPTSDMRLAIDSSIKGVHLLDHPYYRVWQDGGLQEADLAEYAGQYRHFERGLPEALSEAAARMEDGPARAMVQANLADELSNPRPHIELFEQFAAAVGCDDERAPTAATEELVDLYRDASLQGPVALLAVVGAYERQAAAIATTKRAALSDLYGLDAAGTEFWSVHSAVEEQHSIWTVEALELLGASGANVEQWAGCSARAWWAFLDEREAARAA